MSSAFARFRLWFLLTLVCGGFYSLTADQAARVDAIQGVISRGYVLAGRPDAILTFDRVKVQAAGIVAAMNEPHRTQDPARFERMNRSTWLVISWPLVALIVGISAAYLLGLAAKSSDGSNQKKPTIATHANAAKRVKKH